jgi:hypothetical protein
MDALSPKVLAIGNGVAAEKGTSKAPVKTGME